MKHKFIATVLSVGMLMISTMTVFAKNTNPVGAVYSMTNVSNGNSVVVFSRDEEGILTNIGSVLTGGKGSGGGFDPLASQNSLVLSHDHRWLLAVNGGSNELSLFRVLPDGLELADKVASGGTFPVSVTVDQNLVYVLNAGPSPNITGFNLSQRGHLTPLSNSTRSLVSTGAFSQIGFDPEGNKLVVTDRAESQIIVYSVSDDGLPAATPVTSASNGKVPFGFIFDERGHLVVVEVGPDAVSTYNILPNDTLQVISGSVVNGQKAACWIAGNERGDIFTTNPGSGTISSYNLMPQNGQVSLLNATDRRGNKPLDLGITSDGRFLYALDPGSGNVDMFRIERDGSLSNLGVVYGQFALFAQGIAVR